MAKETFGTPLTICRLDELRQTEDQKGVPKGMVRMRWHFKDGTVDTETHLIPSLEISDKTREELKKIRYHNAHGLMQRGIMCFD